jgi:hypothetical protein
MMSILNALLVHEQVRPAMLVQPADYDEATGRDPQTKSIVQTIQAKFPELVASEDYFPYQGVILSRTEFHGEISLERMGEILGYPCPGLTGTHVATLWFVDNQGTQTEFYANISNGEVAPFHALATKAHEVFAKEYPLFHHIQIDVIQRIPIRAVIEHLLTQDDVQPAFQAKVYDVLSNMGFTQAWTHLEWNNPVHRGILLTLLTTEQNNPLSAFYPLQLTPYHSEVKALTRAWEQDLLSILVSTKRMK